MQRILSLYDWRHLPVGSAASIETDLLHQRSVRLRVNAPSPMALYIQQDDVEDLTFLAYIVGLDEIQFEVQGGYRLIAQDGDVWIDTQDGSIPSVEPVSPDSFTQIVERRVRNPELELMERKMQENIERRMAAMYANVTQTIAMKDAEIAAARKASETIDTIAPAQTDGQTPSGEPAAAADAGNGGTSGDE